jgi:hypothetical protein
MQLSGDMGLPARIAIPILTVVAVVFIAIMGYLVKLGFSEGGTALGSGVPAEQGDARVRATAPPVGTFTIPQTGNGLVAPASALPGNTVGGGGPPGK